MERRAPVMVSKGRAQGWRNAPLKLYSILLSTCVYACMCACACMHICMRACAHMCMHVHVCMHVCVRVHVCMHACTCTRTCVFAQHACVCICMCVACVHMCVHVRVFVCVFMCARAPVHAGVRMGQAAADAVGAHPVPQTRACCALCRPPAARICFSAGGLLPPLQAAALAA